SAAEPLAALRLPAPRIPAGVVEAELRTPSEFAVRLGRVGDRRSDVTVARGCDDVGDVPASRLGEGADDLQHVVPDARAQVVHLDSGGEVLECGEVSAGEIHDVDVVAHPRAVERG